MPPIRPKPYWKSPDGAATVYCGDCMKILPTLPKVDVVITDPPYLTTNAEIKYEHTGVAKRTMPTHTVGTPWGYSLDWIDLCGEPFHWVLYANYQMLGGVHGAISSLAQISCVFTWRKSNAPNMTRPVPRLDCEFIVWARSVKAKCDRMGEFKSMVLDVPMPQGGCMATERILEPGSGKSAHPCQKPLAVVYPFVDRLGSHEDTILDPFMGSGTTGVAAIRLGRKFIGIEISEKYCAIAVERIKTEWERMERLRVAEANFKSRDYNSLFS